MEGLKIEDGVSFPAGYGGIGQSVLTEALFKMKVGQSVVTTISSTLARARVSYVKNKKGYKFITRSIEGGLRIWRSE